MYVAGEQVAPRCLGTGKEIRPWTYAFGEAWVEKYADIYLFLCHVFREITPDIVINYLCFSEQDKSK